MKRKSIFDAFCHDFINAVEQSKPIIVKCELGLKSYFDFTLEVINYDISESTLSFDTENGSFCIDENDMVNLSCQEFSMVTTEYTFKIGGVKWLYRISQ